MKARVDQGRGRRSSKSCCWGQHADMWRQAKVNAWSNSRGSGLPQSLCNRGCIAWAAQAVPVTEGLWALRVGWGARLCGCLVGTLMRQPSCGIENWGIRPGSLAFPWHLRTPPRLSGSQFPLSAGWPQGPCNVTTVSWCVSLPILTWAAISRHRQQSPLSPPEGGSV